MQKLDHYHLHALHGFLGHPKDWLTLNLAQHKHFHAYQILVDFPICPFAEWAERFNQSLITHDTPKNNILIGYSLGGRLGLHSLLNQPKHWKAAIFLSTHPGLKTPEEKKTRMIKDHQWGERFEKDPWEILMRDWNAQDIFKHDLPIYREESDYDRLSLSKALATWSLGAQDDVHEKIALLEIPILWMVGEKDLKFLRLSSQLKFKHPQSKLYVVSEFGHRLISRRLEEFILNFIQNLGETKDDENINR